MLDTIASTPRLHLGNFAYDPGSKARSLLPNVPSQQGFTSNPKPLPISLIENHENNIFTIKVYPNNLISIAKEKITLRRFL